MGVSGKLSYIHTCKDSQHKYSSRHEISVSEGECVHKFVIFAKSIDTVELAKKTFIR